MDSEIVKDNFILPTWYNGIKYRSRTEARWARFFTEAGIKFYYEEESFLLPKGPYLPDFTLIYYNGAKKIYAEVKGDKFTIEQKEKCKKLSELTGCDVVMLDGVPDFKTYQVFTKSIEPECKQLSECKKTSAFDSEYECNCIEYQVVKEIDAILCTSSCKYAPFFWCPGFENKDGFFSPSDWYDDHADAIYAAQNERFGIFDLT